MNIITSNHLILIDRIVKHGTLVAAAESMNVTQSALSHQLKDLENKLGTKVLSKRGRKFELTETGKIIWESSQKILHELAKLHKEIDRLNEVESRNIRLCTECYTSYHWFPSVLKQIKAAKDKIEVQIIADYTANPIRALLEGNLDLAITSEKNEHPQIYSEELFVDELVAIFSKNHPFAKQKTIITPDDFQFLDFIHYDASNRESFLVTEYLSPRGITPKSITRIAFTELIFDMIKANLGVAVLSSWYVRPYINNNDFKILKLNGTFRNISWYANYFHGKESMMKPFCMHLRKVMIPIYI